MLSNINQVIVIGGGLSGLIAASQLQQQGFDLTVLDKGYGIGGRLASRPLASEDKRLGFFDYGMQYFRAKDSGFQAWINALIDAGVITLWPGKIQGGVETSAMDEGPCYRGVQGNRAIAQYLAKNLTVINQTRVETLHWQGSEWMIKATNGESFEADAVIMTPPVPQTLDILVASDVALNSEVRSRLGQISYEPCLSLMVVCDRPSHIPAPGGLHVKDSRLDWIASNYIKGISPEGYAITLLAGADFSEMNWDADAEWVISTLMEAAQPWLAEGTVAIATRLHRWKYRHPKTVFGQRALMVEQPGPLVLAGDAFCDRPVEDQALNLEQAFLSGRYAAQYLMKHDQATWEA